MKRLVGAVLVVALIVGALSSHGKSSTTPTVTASAEESASVPRSTTPTTIAASYTHCDQNIKAAPHTSCGFADNVFMAFARAVSSGAGAEAREVVATSPATGHTLTVECRTSEGHTVCSTGGQTRVRFPFSAARVYHTAAPKSETTPSYEPESAEPYEEEPAEPEPGESEPYEPEPECTNGTYVNAAGNTVCSPEESPSAPAGATAECADGTYSFSESRSGTCSHHGGVAAWLE
jgi:hypothetical protein